MDICIYIERENLYLSIHLRNYISSYISPRHSRSCREGLESSQHREGRSGQATVRVLPRALWVHPSHLVSRLARGAIEGVGRHRIGREWDRTART
jgi:hypothetical protein